MTTTLLDAIAADLATWERPVVELGVFGTTDPAAIAASIDAVCRSHLGVAVRSCMFYGSSVGCVAGLELEDGRCVVLKAHQPRAEEAQLRACQAVQTTLVASRFPCPVPILAPMPLGHGLCTVESYERLGVRRDAHEPHIRTEIAARLHELMMRAGEAAVTGLTSSWFTSLGPHLWPTPHNGLFDFEATAEGAQWIDELALRSRRVAPAGRRVIAHFDWRAEHFLFEGDRIATVYDWDSLHLDHEPVAVGAAAHAFTAQWDDDVVPPAPSTDEILSFIDDYELARGRPFDREERHACHASCVYSLAYTARCGHCLDPQERNPRTAAFRQTLRESAPRLLGEEA